MLVPEGSTKERIKQIQDTEADVVVLNYEAMLYLKEFLLSRRWGFVILDESTAVGNFSADRTRYVALPLSKTTSLRRIMTGTPNPNDPALQLFSQFEFLVPGVFGGNYYRFKDRYCILGGFNRKEVIGYKHLDELYAVIERYSSQVPDTVLGLPERVYNDVDAVLSGPTLKAYEEMRDELRTWWDGTEVKARLAITQLLRLAQIAGGTLQEGDFKHWIPDNPKIKVLDEELEEALRKPKSKAVVFAVYQEEIEQITNRYPQYQPRAIYGKVTKTVSDKAWQDFQKEGDPGRLMISQIHSGGISIDLYAARTAIYYTRNFSLEDYIQSQKRLHRMGQTGTVRIRHIMARLPMRGKKRPKSIDEVMAKALDRKQRLSAGVMKGKFTKNEIVDLVNEALE